MDFESFIPWFLGIGFPASIGFAWRITALLVKVSASQAELADNLKIWRDEARFDEGRREKYELRREEIWASTLAGVNELVRMHMQPDAFGFGTQSINRTLRDTRDAIQASAKTNENMALAIADLRDVLRWLIENKGEGLPPQMRG